jgi:hypothetical protein
MNVIATVPAAGREGFVVYRLGIADLPMPTEREFLRLEILLAGNVWRELLIDVSALDGLIRGLQKAAQMREEARVDVGELLSRISKGEAA